MSRDLPRRIGFWGASSVMVGIIVGSGIFQTPTTIAQQTGSPWLVLAAWAAGGLLSLFGALTFSELAVMHPHSGGVYVFLREGFGRSTAFVFGWTYMLITKPVAAAGIAITFAEHVNTLLGVAWDPRVTTSVLLAALTVVNIRGVALGTGLAAVLTVIKVGALVALVALAAVLSRGSLDNFTPAPSEIPVWRALAPIMFGVLWTYDGWSDVGSVAGEVVEPQRTLPRAYLLTTVFVTVLYLGVNAVYLAMIPLDRMAGMKTVAPAVMDMLLGPAGATVLAALVVISTAGSTHGSIMTGARITFAQARDGLLFRFLGGVHPRYETPSVSLWTQLALSVGAVWLLGNFRALADTFVFTMWIFYGLAGLTIFILRRRAPDAPRAFRCPGYPVVPAVFVAAALWMTVMSIIDSPRSTLPWLGVLAVGYPVYALWDRLTARGATRPS